MKTKSLFFWGRAILVLATIGFNYNTKAENFKAQDALHSTDLAIVNGLRLGTLVIESDSGMVQLVPFIRIKR